MKNKKAKNQRMSLTRREEREISLNYLNMSKKSRKALHDNVHVLVLLPVILRTIKAKLGFGYNTPDRDFLFNAKGIHAALLADIGGFFTPVFALMALLLTQITEYEQKLEDVVNGVTGAEEAKTTAKSNLFSTLKQALMYINGIALADQPNAAEIIADAAMQVIVPGARNKQDFAVKQGAVTGCIVLDSLAYKVDGKYKEACYNWQFSIDNGATWTDLPTTLKAKTVAVDMPVNTWVLFRKRIVTGSGTDAWCTPIGITPV